MKVGLKNHAKKVFGVGWAKTGTSTLGKCFKILGFDHQSQNLDLIQDVAANDLTKIMKIAETKETFEDWPWILLYKEMDKAFPNSKFILTKRASGKWIRSYRNMLTHQGEATDDLNRIRQNIYGLPFPDVSDHQLIERYERHNEDVERYFIGRPKQLLAVDWEKGDSWREICQFLKMDIPLNALPHENKGRYVSSMIHRLTDMLTKRFKMR